MGYLMAGAFFDCSKLLPLRRSPRRKRERRKRGRETRAMKRRARSCWMASLLLRGWWSGVFTSSANATDLDLSNDEKSNGGGDSSDDDA